MNRRTELCHHCIQWVRQGHAPRCADRCKALRLWRVARWVPLIFLGTVLSALGTWCAQPLQGP